MTKKKKTQKLTTVFSVMLPTVKAYQKAYDKRVGKAVPSRRVGK